jgi:mannitol-1-phosphate 5-dehydrogenase
MSELTHAKKAVHFGAGNIGRGFVGLILHNSGYEVVFADVAAALIDELAATPSYVVHEVGKGARTWTVDNYRALNSATHADLVVAEIATADVVTTAVGPNVLKFVAPLIALALAQRAESAAPLTVMACENAIGATDTLAEHVAAHVADATLLKRAVFANTAVDRIVPNQPAGGGIDVTVEAFFEWVIEKAPFIGDRPIIPEAEFVDDLTPFIERKLFTVNTGHATTAYFGFLAGVHTIAEAMAVPSVAAEVRAVLGETKALLVDKHHLPEQEQQAYLEKNLERFSNTALDDTVVRVGRQPMRKLSRHERFVGPAAELAENGHSPVALVRAMVAATKFAVDDDPQSVELRALRASVSTTEFVAQVTGLEPGHPLFAQYVAALDA